MSTPELKSDLHRLVEETNDPLILKQVAALFATLRAEGGDWWELISETEKMQIEAGRADVAEGKIAPHEAVMAKAKNILNNKIATQGM